MDEPYTYKASLRPVTFATLPEDIADWSFVHQPGSLEGGRYGVVALPRGLDEDERSRFGFAPVSLPPAAPGLSDLSRNGWQHDAARNVLVHTPPEGAPYELDLGPLDRDGWNPREQLRRVKHVAGKAWATAEAVWDLTILFQELEAAWGSRADTAVPIAESQASRARGMLQEAHRETVQVLERRRDGMPAGADKNRLCRALDSLARGCADADDELCATLSDKSAL